jgi:nucleotide-binding universal stress UspA family protein
MILPKVEIKKILYTTDLSENARYAFAYAVSLANMYGAGLTILHVLNEDPGLEAKVSAHIGEEQWEKIRNQTFQEAREALIGKKRDNIDIREILFKFSEDVKAGLESPGVITDEILVEKGNPVTQILKQSEERNCDLIVMGSHGHGSFADAMMGSTAQRVLRRSKKPVLVIRLNP